MNSWYKITLSNEDLAAGKHMKLQDEFEAIFVSLFASSEPPSSDFAMFGNRKFSRNNHNFFFSEKAMSSPLLQLLMRAYSGVPCERPMKDDVSLLVGHANSWNIFDDTKIEEAL